MYEKVFLPEENIIIAKTLLNACTVYMNANTEHHLWPQVTYALTPSTCYKWCISTSLCLWVVIEELLKGRCRGNKWRISSLLNGALEGLWLWVVGYKTQRLGCTRVLVYWLGWQLCCLGVVLGHTLGHALRCSFGTGALSGPTRGRFRKRLSPTWRFAPLLPNLSDTK